jgi:hypothetical protein
VVAPVATALLVQLVVVEVAVEVEAESGARVVVVQSGMPVMALVEGEALLGAIIQTQAESVAMAACMVVAVVVAPPLAVTVHKASSSSPIHLRRPEQPHQRRAGIGAAGGIERSGGRR